MTDEERQQLLDLIKQAKEGKQYAFTQLIIVIAELYTILYIILYTIRM